MKKTIASLFWIVCCSAVAGAALPQYGPTMLREGWRLESSAKVTADGAAISQPGFSASAWYPAAIPSTVLAALVANHVYPDPDFGMNLRHIPGVDYPIGGNFSNLPMPADSPFNVPWWYRKAFTVPASYQGQHIALHFNGLNYRANIWLNGQKIADSSQVAGMWRRFEFDVTGVAQPGKTNVLAIQVFPPQPDDLSITFVDWNPLPPDKDMGLYRDVYLTASGVVALRDAQVESDLELPSLATAQLTVRATVRNLDTKMVQGTLEGQIGSIHFQQTVALGNREAKLVAFVPSDYAQLKLDHPRVWWPAGLGAQNLYDLHLQFVVAGKVMDQEQVRFGVRSITSHLDSQNHRVFQLNGHNILIRGAGWTPDMLLRWSPARMAAELSYVLNMHLNTIRLEGKLEDDEFFDSCDRSGILVIAGWCCCDHWEKWKSWKQEDYVVAADSLRDQLRRLRNHPCMLTWLYGSDHHPPENVETTYLRVLSEEHWPNPYQSSATAAPTRLQGPTGLKMTGPYEYVAPSYWLLDTKNGGAYGFNTETSPGPAVPPLESLERMLPKDHLWPIDDVWNFHAGGGEFKTIDVFKRALEGRYGNATGVADFAEKSQVMAYEGERAMFEAYGRNKYTSTGVIQWMLNNAWPSMIWHLYDYYLRPGGGFYGTQRACEPLHIQYSYDDQSIVVVNSLRTAFKGYHASARILNLDMTEKYSRQTTVDIDPDSVSTLFALPRRSGLSTTYFVRLELAKPNGEVVSRNFYWLSTHPDVSDFSRSTWFYTPIESYADMTGLRRLPEVELKFSSTHQQSNGKAVDLVSVENPSKSLAFFVHLSVRQGKEGAEVLPALWDDNYFSLLPGERRSLRVQYSAQSLGGHAPAIKLDGWNVKPATE